LLYRKGRKTTRVSIGGKKKIRQTQSPVTNGRERNFEGARERGQRKTRSPSPPCLGEGEEGEWIALGGNDARRRRGLHDEKKEGKGKKRPERKEGRSRS